MANSIINGAKCGKESSKQNSTIKITKISGGKLFCSMCCAGEAKRNIGSVPKSIITTLAMIANNYLSGSKVWTTNGVIMNLELPSIIYRSNV